MLTGISLSAGSSPLVPYGIFATPGSDGTSIMPAQWPMVLGSKLYSLSIFHSFVQLIVLYCSFVSFQPSEIEMESQVHLYGHTAEITSLFVCKPYSIMISVSKDGTCIIWDLNRYKYI